MRLELVCLLLAFVGCTVYAQTSEVNVALNKPITAEVTCGSPPEFFYAHKEIVKPAQNRVRSLCDSSNSSLAHPPQYAVDPDSSTGESYTWWQSTSRNNLVDLGYISPDTILTIDLQEVFSIQKVTIQMGDSVRPDQMALLRSNDGVTFIPWEYKVTSSQECINVFDVSSINTAVESSESVICNTYSLQAQTRNEIISFDFDVPDVLKDWKNARYIRFEFYNMPRNFGFRADDYYHYTVRNIVAMATCNCNGHASECTIQPSLTNPDVQNYRCVCQGNTQGSNCQECLPFYNQLAYETGENGFVCQKCNCFGHSEECVYDADIASFSLSQDEFGNFSGGGVCQNCQNYTAGTNCESCQPFFFRPSGKSQSDEDACQPCDCHLPGTREEALLGIQRGECVVNDEINLPDMSPGDCFCKSNVIGARCDQCVPGTYDLNDINPEGCRDCNCFLAGTLSGSNECNTTMGQCPCKPSTTGRQCNQCLQGYYNITASNPDGCSECACDVGGALSHICDSVSGLCSCRPGIIGRQCSSASATTFVPTLHFFSSEFESLGHPGLERDESYSGFSSFGYVTLSGTASTTVVLTIPPSRLSGTYEILLRVITQGITRVTLTITPEGGTQGRTATGTADIPLCPTWCFEAQVLNSDPAFGSRFLLSPGSWEITLDTTLQGGAKILLDEIVALPVEFEDPTVLLGQNTASQFVATCDVRNNDMRLGTRDEEFCLAQVFSIMTYYLDGTQACNCDVVGSTSSQCDTYGGQCPCKPGVGGRRCDICLPEFYGFGPTGCVECSCFGDDKVCDTVTGQCNCPPNTVGRRCDRCVTFSYDLDSTAGCKMCDCNTDGSTNRQCDSVTGQCPCKPGVGSHDCSECLPGFKMFSDAGCEPCDCNPAGSNQSACDQVTGQCQCMALVQGLTCDECPAGSFYLSESNPEGCLECICMGITDQCDSTTQRYSQIPINPNFLPVDLPVNSNLFWEIPDTYLSGDFLGLYGSTLHFTMSYQSDAPMPISLNIRIQGDTMQAIFSTTILEPSDNMSIEVPVQETFWMRQNSATISRSEFLLLLVSVSSIHVSGTISNSTHTSRVTDGFFSMANPPSSDLYDPAAPRAFPVEQCLCGDGYEGLSCQSCQAGYYRQDVGIHPYLGTCQPCQCNGHSGLCDVDTGQCLECLHNTAGFNCEFCDNGFYGNATIGTETDCQPCPCSNLTTITPQCAVISGMVVCLQCSRGHTGILCDECVDFYYGHPEQPGGFCSPCNCNGNSDQCDPSTGMCLGCQFRTEGFNCERCQNFLYGNATQQDCQDCNCQPAGSESLLCDVVTGQCPCLSNVTGRQCDQCLPNYYGYGDANGCSPCDCNLFGSTGLQCSFDGSCPCFAGTEGPQCDRCMEGSYGLPDARCQACSCDSLGTVGGASAVCDLIDGQCPCKVGITGRACDQCSAGFVNFTAGSCSKCDRCVDTLLNSTQDIEGSLANHWMSVEVLHQLQERDATLMTLGPQINDSYVQMTSLLDQLTTLRGQLEGIRIENITTMSDDLQGAVTFVASTVQTDLSNSIQELTRISNITDAASTAYTSTEDLRQTADRYIMLASGWNASSFIMKQGSTRLLAEIMTVAFDMSIAVAARELTKSQGVLERAKEHSNGTNEQAAEAAALVEFLEMTKKVIGELEGNITTLEGALDSADSDLTRILALVNQKNTYENSAEDMITQAESQLTMVASLMNRTTIYLEEANQAFINAQIILEGSQEGSTGVPVPESLDQQGINGWNEAAEAVRNAVLRISQRQTILPPRVVNAESHVQDLQLETLSSMNLLSSTRAVSQAAYQAVQTYRKVVSVVDEAQQLAANATSVSQAVQDYLNTRDLTVLETEASNLEAESLNVLSQVQISVPNTQAMETALQEANQTVQQAKELWELVDGSRQDFESSVQGLQNHVSESSIGDVIVTGHQIRDDTMMLSSFLLNNVSQLNASLQESRSTVETLQDTVNNGTLLQDGFPDKVSSLEASEEEISAKFDTLYQLTNQTTELRSQIAEKMAALRVKLAQAQNHLVNSKFPARFEGSTALTLRRESDAQQTLYDEVRLSFRTEQRDGLLFFTENREGKSFMSLEIVASRVVFRFRIADDIVRVQSPIDVCCEEWYSVLATRYANQGELTVTKISTGGSSTDFDRSLNVFLMYMPFQANTTLHIGGIPRNYQFDVALSRDFTGCISDVAFEEEEFDLWQPYSLEGATSCCEAPEQVVPPVPLVTDGVSFNGFGYLEIPQADFDVYNEGSISLEFRTSVAEAVIFSVSRPDLISYIGVFLTNGRVVFEFNTAGNAKYTVKSTERYNDTDWHKVFVSYNSTNYKMELSYLNGTIQERFDRRTLYSLTFPNLRFSARSYLGSADPDNQLASVRGPTDLSFAGCLRNLFLSNTTSGVLTHVPVTEETAVTHTGVEFGGCLAEVREGFEFSGDFAFAQLRIPDQLRATKSLEFYFKTEQPHGILAYSYDAQSFNKLFYVALYHGNIFVRYNVGKGLSEPLQTKGEKLNNGQWQLVTIQFTALSVSLKVNSQATIYSSRQLGTDGIQIDGLTNSFLYLGGVPASIPILIGGQFPVRESLSGDMRSFTINDVSPNLNDPEVVVGEKGLRLTGVSPAVQELPPLPYPTDSAGQGTSTPESCQPPVDVVPYPDVIRFGATGDQSYLGFTLDSSQINYFLSSFVIKVQFRAHSSEGILYYGANRVDSPSEWFSLILRNGRLSFNMITTSAFTTGLDVSTNTRYDTGQWYEVLVLRISDFIAILVDETDEYVKGQGATSVNSQIRVQTDLYVGGVSQDIINPYISSVLNGRSFDGCIRMFEVSSNFARDLVLPLSSPTVSKSTELCEQNAVELKTFFTGSGYLKLRDNMTVSSGFQVKIDFSTTEQQALLFAVSQNEDTFVALDLFDGGVRVIVDHNTGQPTVVRATSVQEFQLCDGKPHLVEFTVTDTYVEISVDGQSADRTAFQAGQSMDFIGPLYLGGIPETGEVNLITGINTASFRGCLAEIVVNEEPQDLDFFVERSGVQKGCPLAIP